MTAMVGEKAFNHRVGKGILLVESSSGCLFWCGVWRRTAPGKALVLFPQLTLTTSTYHYCFYGHGLAATKPCIFSVCVIDLDGSFSIVDLPVFSCCALLRAYLLTLTGSGKCRLSIVVVREIYDLPEVQRSRWSKKNNRLSSNILRCRGPGPVRTP